MYLYVCGYFRKNYPNNIIIKYGFCEFLEKLRILNIHKLIVSFLGVQINSPLIIFRKFITGDEN